VELVVRRSGTHRTLAPDISRIARPIELLGLPWATLGLRRISGLSFSKYPPENTRQVRVLISA
jgi:hypothetical protein